MNKDKKIIPQVGVEHYEFKKYISKRRWISFYHQIDEIISVRGVNSILEIGVGSGILGTVLKRLNYLYESIDIDVKLHPDHIGSVLKMPFPDKIYDIIGCFEVLEHLPFEQFETALSELFRVSRKAVILSLPNARKMWEYAIYIPKIGCKKILVPRPFSKEKEAIFDGEHYWGLNKKGYSVSRIIETVRCIAQKYNFTLIKEYRVWENPYHHFFVLKSIDSDYLEN
jgi:2-polyprenyl-3-methyl-5-hydroxy-6-metoxy-1,4-benzoquinol methylase